jgi:hypothetical protein
MKTNRRSCCFILSPFCSFVLVPYALFLVPSQLSLQIANFIYGNQYKMSELQS